jgi:hypothetical protein
LAPYHRATARLVALSSVTKACSTWLPAPISPDDFANVVDSFGIDAFVKAVTGEGIVGRYFVIRRPRHARRDMPVR